MINKTFDFIFRTGIIGHILNIRNNVGDTGKAFVNICALLRLSESNGHDLSEFYKVAFVTPTPILKEWYKQRI